MCFCSTSYGRYGQLDDGQCGSSGDACGLNSSKYTSVLGCDMKNAVFQIPVQLCRDITCADGTVPDGDSQSSAAISVFGLGSAEAQAICCHESCATWHASSSCAAGTTFVTQSSDTFLAGSDPQVSCCTSPCQAGSYRVEGRCVACLAGTASNTIDATECTAVS